MWNRRKDADPSPPPFPPGLLAEAKTKPGGWVYGIDPAYAPDGVDGAIPPEEIIGGWRIGDDGLPTGKYIANPRYQPPTK
jgi:hypothetical protein